jgi:ammonia channel protein AmtB
MLALQQVALAALALKMRQSQTEELQQVALVVLEPALAAVRLAVLWVLAGLVLDRTVVEAVDGAVQGLVTVAAVALVVLEPVVMVAALVVWLQATRRGWVEA